MEQLSLGFSKNHNPKQKKNTSSNKIKSTYENILKTEKLSITKPKELESNHKALEKIRKNQFSSDIFNINLPEILSPEEIESIYYISLQKNAEKEKIFYIIKKSIKKIKSINKEKEIEIDISNLENLFEQINSEEETFQSFLDEYKDIYEKINIKEKSKINEHLNLYEILNLVPIDIFSQKKINVFTNKISPLIRAINPKQINVFFTEKDYIKRYITKKALKGEYLGKTFCESLKDIRSKSIELALLFINENKIKISKEDIIEIRKNTISKKLIENNIAKEGSITYEAIHPKMKNFGISVIIGPSSILTNKKLKFKKHELIAIPLFTIYYYDDSENTTMNINAIDVNGKQKEVKVNKAISIFCTMKEEDFMKSPIDQNPYAFFVENLKQIKSIKKLEEYKKILKNLEYINSIRINNEFKKIFNKTCKDLISELKISRNFLIASILKEILENIEKENIEKLDRNKYIKKLINYTNQEKRIKNLFKINLIKSSKQSIINPQIEKEIEYIKSLSEKLFLKLKSNEMLILYHLKIISKLINEDDKYIPYDISQGGKFKSEGQVKYAKPFEFLFCKNDFINLCVYTSQDFSHRKKVIKILEDALKEIKIIKSNNQKALLELNKNMLEIINKTTKKEFKNLSEAFKYIFSYNENRTIDKKLLIHLEKTLNDTNLLYLIEILKLVSKGYINKIIKHNNMSKIYSEMPSIIQKIKDIFTYIENKENIVTRITIDKTLKKINSLEEELQNINI